jgi:nicotinate-nucleotide adenylyltransferase
MRVALYGGTFDPVHTGHLLIAEYAREAFQLDHVVFIPTAIPPHKSAPATPAHHRLHMLRLAMSSNPKFTVNDWEIRLKRVVYSFETIAHFRTLWPQKQLSFIVGTDMLRDIDLWKTGRHLLKQCRFLVAERPGVPWSSLPRTLRQKTSRIEWPAVPFASHEIRARVRKGLSIRYQVPDKVASYIAKHRLYLVRHSPRPLAGNPFTPTGSPARSCGG